MVRIMDAGSDKGTQMNMFKSLITELRKFTFDLINTGRLFLSRWRDVKSLKDVLVEIHFNGILVPDTGFSSQDLAEIMLMSMRFIMPFRRNQDMIDYTMDLNSSFVCRDRESDLTSSTGMPSVYTFSRSKC